MKSPGGHPSDTENGLTIVLQKWMLPMVNSVNQQAVSSLLHKRLEYLRQRILWFSNHRLMDELPPLPIHHSPVLIPKALETKYLEEVGFIDKDTLKSLSFELQCLNMADLLKTIEMTTTIREKHSVTNLLDAFYVLTNFFFKPVAWMMQHQIISFMCKIRKEDYPHIDSLISKWFQSQQQRYCHKKSLIAFQLAADHQLQARMELVEIMVNSLLLFPLMLEERANSIYKEGTISRLIDATKDRDSEIIPTENCLELLSGIYEQCESLIELSLEQSWLESTITRVHECINALSKRLQAIDDTSQHIMPTMKILNIQYVLEFIVITSNMTIGRAMLTMMERIMDEETNRIVVMDNRVTIAITTEGEPFTRPYCKSKRWPFIPRDLIESFMHELITFGLMSVAMTERKSVASSWRTVRKEISRNMDKASCFYHYKSLFLQQSHSFDPWCSVKPKAIKTTYLENGDCDSIDVMEVIEVGMRMIWMQQQQLRLEQYWVSGRITRSSYNALLSWHRADLINLLFTSINVVISYLCEAYHSYGVSEFERRQFRYHQRCYDLVVEATNRRATLIDMMIAVAVENPNQIGLVKLMTASSIGDHCVINYGDLLFSDVIALVIDESNSASKVNKDSIVSDKYMQQLPEYIVTSVVLIAILGIVRIAVMQHMLSQFLLRVLRAMSWDRVTYHVNGEVELLSRNTIMAEAFENFDYMMEVVDRVKYDIAEACGDPLDKAKLRHTMESLSMHSLFVYAAMNISARICSVHDTKREQSENVEDDNLEHVTGEDGDENHPELAKIDDLNVLDAKKQLAIALQDDLLMMYERWYKLSQVDNKHRLIAMERQVLRIEMTLRVILLSWMTLVQHLNHCFEHYCCPPANPDNGDSPDQARSGEGSNDESIDETNDENENDDKYVSCDPFEIMLTDMKIFFQMLYLIEVAPEHCFRMKNNYELGTAESARQMLKDHFIPPLLHTISTMLRTHNGEPLYGDKVGSDEGKTNVIKNLDLLSVYLNWMERGLDIVLIEIQILTHSEASSRCVNCCHSAKADESESDDEHLPHAEIFALHFSIETTMRSTKLTALHDYLSSALLNGSETSRTHEEVKAWLMEEVPRKTHPVCTQMHIFAEMLDHFDGVIIKATNHWCKVVVEDNIQTEELRLNAIGKDACDDNTQMLLEYLCLR